MLKTIVYYVGVMAICALIVPLGVLKSIAVIVTFSILLFMQYDRGIDQGIKIGTQWTLKVLKKELVTKKEKKHG